MNQATQKPTGAIERNFVDAFERLIRANAGYDEGRISEAPNIAKEVFSFIDPVRGRGLLANLGLDAADFMSSAEPQPPGNLAPEYRLIDAIVGFDGMDYRAFLDRARVRAALKLAPWLDEVVLAKVGLDSIRRGELVKFIRDVEGGGHVGIKYERSQAKFAGMMTGDYIDGYMHLDGGPPVGPEFPYLPAFATIRQVGWELEYSLRRICPDLVARVDLNPRPGPRMVPIQQI